MCNIKNGVTFHRRDPLGNFKAIGIFFAIIYMGFFFSYVDSAISACGTCPGAQCDSDCDGIPDSSEVILNTNPNIKTLFLRPILETSSGNQQYGVFFIQLFSNRNFNGTINICAFANKNIEIRVIGDSQNPNNYCNPTGNCLNYFPYDPARDPNCLNCRILEIIYDTHSPWCQWAPNAYGHIYFDENRVTWSWDTKGYTLSTGEYGYNTASIYAVPLANYFNEGPYKVIGLDEGPEQDKDNWKFCSPLNTKDNWTPPNSYPSDPSENCQPPDVTVEFNPFVFHSNQTIWKMPPAGTVTKKYSQDDVLRRTIIHEMGHALLAGQDTDHCDDPDCIMYWGVKDWDLKSFGPRSCEHKNGGSLNIGAYGVVYNGP